MPSRNTTPAREASRTRPRGAICAGSIPAFRIRSDRPEGVSRDDDRRTFARSRSSRTTTVTSNFPTCASSTRPTGDFAFHVWRLVTEHRDGAAVASAPALDPTELACISTAGTSWSSVSLTVAGVVRYREWPRQNTGHGSSRSFLRGLRFLWRTYLRAAIQRRNTESVSRCDTLHISISSSASCRRPWMFLVCPHLVFGPALGHPTASRSRRLWASGSNRPPLNGAT